MLDSQRKEGALCEMTSKNRPRGPLALAATAAPRIRVNENLCA